MGCVCCKIAEDMDMRTVAADGISRETAVPSREGTAPFFLISLPTRQ